MDNRLKAVIFDWAGTVVDYGCFAPLQAFQSAFENRGVAITAEEARAPMGLLKRDHIRSILNMERVRTAWVERFGAPWTEADLEGLYADFEGRLMESLEVYTDPIPGVLELVEQLRREGKKIGSTTGYTQAMMDVVAPAAKRKGYAPDFMVAADELKRGRPYPYMLFRNMEELDAFPPRAVMKVGDTVSDVREGNNAGVWTVAVLKGGSELGLTQLEVESMNREELQARMDAVRVRFEEAGANFVIESIDRLPEVIALVESGGGKEEKV